MTRLLFLALFVLAACTACGDDPQHGPYKVNRWFGLISVVALVVGGLIAGVAYQATRYLLARRRAGRAT